MLLVACNQTTVNPTATTVVTQVATPTVITTTQALPTVPAIPTATPTARPTLTPTPPPPTPTATLPPFKPTEQALGGANCCQEFAFAADGRLYYYDKPQGATRAGTYLHDLATNQRTLLNNQFGIFSPNLEIIAVSQRDRGLSTIEQVKDGKLIATLQNKGDSVVFSPDNRQIAYLLRLPTPEGASAPQNFEVWVGEVSGANLRPVWKGREGDNLTWFPDNRRILLTARDAANRLFGLWVVDTITLTANLIIESKGLISAGLSADGKQIVYGVIFQGDNESGVWRANADGTRRTKFSWQGGWAWSFTNPAELFYLPLGAEGESLWSFNPATGQATRLTDPNSLKLRVAENQWKISPDGKSLVYRKADDYSVALVRFRP